MALHAMTTHPGDVDFYFDSSSPPHREQPSGKKERKSESQTSIPTAEPFVMIDEPLDLPSKKLEDYRVFSAIMFGMSAFLGVGLWVWDYVTDPVGAQKTLGLRTLFFAMLLVAQAFRYVRGRGALACISVTAFLMCEVLFIFILNRLNTGMVYGIAGFMFFMFMPLMLFRCFSWKTSALFTLLAASLPHGLALLGFAPGFQHDHYAVLIWPTAALMIAVHYVFSAGYAQRFALETALQLASNTDALTGLSNRRHFMPRLEQEVLRRKRMPQNLALMMLDIDFFKKVNDSYGHATGDDVICGLAEICQQASRETDVVARLGGEEFAILMPGTDVEQASVLAERIRTAFEARNFRAPGGVVFRATVSIGVAEHQDRSHSKVDLLAVADRALYQAKQTGRNQVVWIKIP